MGFGFYDILLIWEIHTFPKASNTIQLFRKHLVDVKMNSDVKVILGQNFRGLIAANEIVKVNKNKQFK